MKERYRSPDGASSSSVALAMTGMDETFQALTKSPTAASSRKGPARELGYQSPQPVGFTDPVTRRGSTASRLSPAR